MTNQKFNSADLRKRLEAAISFFLKKIETSFTGAPLSDCLVL